MLNILLTTAYSGSGKGFFFAERVMAGRSKRYKKDSQSSTKESLSIGEAVKKIKSFASTKFDQSVDCVMHLGIDPKQAADELMAAETKHELTGRKWTLFSFFRRRRRSSA